MCEVVRCWCEVVRYTDVMCEVVRCWCEVVRCWCDV